MIYRVQEVNCDHFVQLANLLSRLNDKECSVSEYLEYIARYCRTNEAAFWIDVRDGVVCGFVHIEPPHPLCKGTGFMVTAISFGDSEGLLKVAEEQFRKWGCDSWEAGVKRSIRPFIRKWNMEPSDYTLLRKKI